MGLKSYQYRLLQWVDVESEGPSLTEGEVEAGRHCAQSRVERSGVAWRGQQDIVCGPQGPWRPQLAPHIAPARLSVLGS